MALATRPRPTPHHRKRSAQHHRHSRGYLRTYWPYLPMLAIVATGVELNKFVYGSGFGFSSLIESNGALTSTRVQAMTNQASWSLLAVVLITAAAAAVFTFTHWRRIHRVLNRGESFAIGHPWLDISLVLILTSGIVLTRAVV